jgi:ZU5 domain-containing protein
MTAPLIARFSPSGFGSLARSAAVAFFAAALSGLPACSDSTTGTGSTADSEVTVTEFIGPEGGKIEIAGATITFPKGALSERKEITITATADPPPAGFVALSRIFECGPTGTDFAQGVTMQMPFTPDGKPATMFWSAGGDPTFNDVGGRVEGGTMIAEVKHFSKGFAGYKQE